jgi:hypothetical protein
MAGDTYVLAINGGGNPQENYASHLAHLRQWVALLSRKGIPRDRIVVLSSDGADPTPDVSVRDPDPEGVWILDGTLLGDRWRSLENFENSVLDGFQLRPATYASLVRTLADLRRRLRPGDTLLLYVTDHGLQSRRDLLGNQIVLWGNRAGISVRQLGMLLANFPREIQVVSLMSQCFSGGFAYLGEARERGRLPIGNTCGFFSSTPDHPAYGCYPEVRGQKAVGHSFEFFSALAQENRFIAAHHETLLSDDSPDIPLRSSDVYWAESLAECAGGTKRDVAFADSLLRQAIATGRFSREWQLAGRIAQRFNLKTPKGIAEIDQQMEELGRYLKVLQADVTIWSTALTDFNEANLAAFQKLFPEWDARLKNRILARLTPSDRRQRFTDFLAAFYPFVAEDTARIKIAERIVHALEGLETITYRTEIRLAVLTRIRFLYLRIAGRFHGEGHRNSHYVKTAHALERCEEFQLPGPSSPARSNKPLSSKPFPTLELDQQQSATLRPAWLGMVYRQVDPFQRNQLGLPPGAVLVTKVIPGSPAAKEGLQRGDVVTHVGGRPLERQGDLRPLIASARPNMPVKMDLRRRGALRTFHPILTTAP